jgi:hypothetical protein
MSSYLNVLLYLVVTSHQVMDTFIKFILIICFKLHVGMVAVMQMLKSLLHLQSSNSDTTYNSILGQLDN